MSCFGGSDERLYLLELLVEKLRLPREKFEDIACADRGGDECPLVVVLKFLDFPTFHISRRDFYFLQASPRDLDGSLEFSTGRTCLFVKQPRDLVREMQSTPLRIGILREGDTYPIAETQVELKGCLCDQISMASNDADHLPPPYTLRGGYHLTDPGGNPSGTINLDVRLSCFGKLVTTRYRMEKKSFVFKNDRQDDRYYVKRLLPTDLGANEAGKEETIESENLSESPAEKPKKKTSGAKKDKKKK